MLGVIVTIFLSILVLFMIFLGLPFNFIIISVLGCFVFVVAFINTDIALIILILSMLLSPQFAVGKVTGRAVVIRADDIFIILVFLGWLAKMAVNKEFGLLRSTPLNTPIFLFVFMFLLSSFLGVVSGRINMKESAFYILKYVEYYLLFFLVSNNLKNMAQVRKFIFFFLLTCSVVCVYAIINPQEGRASAPFEAKGGEPSTFAGYLVIMMGIIIALLLHPDPPRKKLVYLLLLGLAGTAFILTLSRGGWVSFFPMIFTFVLMNKKYRFHLIALMVIAAVTLPMVVPKSVHQRISETFVPWKTYSVLAGKVGVDESTAARIDSWKVGIERWSKNPVVGYGIPAGVVIDNQYTRVLNETGAIGFAIFMWILFTLFMVSVRTYDLTRGNDFARAITLGYLAGFMGLLLLSATAATFIIIRIMEPFWFLTAIIVVLPEIQDTDRLEINFQEA